MWMAGVDVELVYLSPLYHIASLSHLNPIDKAGHDAQVVGDPDDGHAQLPTQLLEQTDDLALKGHIQSCRRLVGDQRSGVAGKAMAIIARWRIPAENYCG